MLRVPSVNPGLGRRIAALEEMLSTLEAVSATARGPEYHPWKEEFLKDRIAELKSEK